MLAVCLCVTALTFYTFLSVPVQAWGKLYFIYLFLVVLGFELRARQVLYHLNISPDLFALVILEIGSCSLPRPAWTIIFLF
jgi:hypothetical protein